MTEKKENITESEVEIPEQALIEEENIVESNENYQEIIEDLNKQIESLNDKLLRNMAETENVRQRSNKLVEEARDYAISAFAKDLLTVIDNLSRALEHVPENLSNEAKNLVEGISMTKNELESVFKKHGLEPIVPLQGEKFNYNNHYAISQVITTEYEAGAIVQTMQIGYKIKDRLIRPAAVTVAASPKE